MDAPVASANGATPAKPVTPQTTASEPHAIAPLQVPWLRHDNFTTVKKVCTADGLMQAKKHSVVRVLQELKKGRTHLQQQLSQMELQLLHVSDFMRDAVDKLEIVPAEATTVVADTKNGVGNGDADANGVHGRGKALPTSDKTNPLNPVAVQVEEDLASETPCTTVGLWRYLSCFAFFKNVTLEDMQEALLLEDPDSAVVTEGLSGDEGDANGHAVHAFDGVDTLPTLAEMPEKQANGKSDSAAHLNELLRMRLVAAMISGAEKRDHDAKLEKLENGTIANGGEDPAEDADIEMKSIDDHDIGVTSNGENAKRGREEDDVEMKSFHTDEMPAMPPSRTLQQLRDIGLVEESTDGVVQSLQHPQDDEVSREIRMLEVELVDQVRRNNEFKRTLRRSLERLKPWLTHDEEIQQVEAKFLKMWRRKKELQRKKKHKVKKQMRKEASYKSAFVMPPPVQTPE